MAEVLTLGELLIDLTQTGVDAAGVRQFAANPGGAPANVAVALSRLGVAAGFIGKVGADAFGRDLRAVLVKNGVDVRGLYETDEVLTTEAVVSVRADGERSFAFYRSPGADTLLTAEEALAALDPLPRVLHVGSVSLTAEPARTATLRAVEAARARGVWISYDPNYRAALWPDEQTAVAWMKRLLPMTDVLKLSDEELPLLTGTDDPAHGTQLLAGHGIRLILLTMGSRGTFYRFGGGTGTVPSVSVRVADTNGAGDTFLGALLRGLVLCGRPPEALTRAELERLIRFANCAAALTCTRHGAIPAMPDLDEAERFVKEREDA